MNKFRSGRSRWVDPRDCTIVKFFPTELPVRGTIVMVDGERHRVLRSKVTWEGRRWVLHKVKVVRDG